MNILTLNECGLVAGGMRPSSGVHSRHKLTTTGTASPDMEPPPGSGGGYGGGGFGSYDAWGAEFGGGEVTYFYQDGAYTTYSGMNHPTRDNNPMDVSFNGGFYGEAPVLANDTGGGNDMSVYGSAAAGWTSAFNDLANLNIYDYGGDATLDDLISKWSPDTAAQPNQTQTVEGEVLPWSGLQGSDTFDSLIDGLHPGELENFMNAYGRAEGYQYLNTHPFTAQDATRS